MCTPGQMDDGSSGYNINQLNYPAPYSDTSLSASLYRSSDAYNLWPVDVPGPRNQGMPANLRRASYANSRYLVSSSNPTSSSPNLSAFPSMAHLENTLPVPHPLSASRPRHSVGSNVQLRSNSLELGINQTDGSQLGSGSTTRASISFPWLDERLSDNYLPSAHTPSASLSGTGGTTYATMTPGLTQDMPLLPHRPSYDFVSQSYSRNPSSSQGADTESLTNLDKYSLSRNAPQPTRSPSDHSSNGSYEHHGPRSYAFPPNVHGNATANTVAASVTGRYSTQVSLGTSLPPRNLSTASSSDAQATSSQAYAAPHRPSRQASTRQLAELAAETSRHSISDASTDSSGK